ncbi:D-sedoheptulose 7-phosphate isomerase [uncultured Sulfitobacter sp.]|uniref:D-sedoheptulose-7-phosphate isomerase n=1 Tax=uncultured Sulfitobacter sp. TaxID=191468 RepID=UPI0025925CEC|nr:D-sedoheptulose 7-phosphate isomerase [uncultured Sulfitobacter sp.]
MDTVFKRTLEEHAELVSRIESLTPAIDGAAQVILGCLQQGGSVFFCGNGGSAADCQHLAAEFTGRFLRERGPLAGVALTTDSSALTAIGNDYGFEEIFARQIAGLGKSDDCLVAISTSGNSRNVIRAVEAAKIIGVATIGLLGRDGGMLKEICDLAVVVPSETTARIQEMHILIGHSWCEAVDEMAEYRVEE